MATLPELEAAFLKADSAGNAEDAQAFATEIKRIRSAPVQETPKPSKTEQLSPYAKIGLGAAQGFLGNGSLFGMGGLFGAVRGAYSEAGNLATENAYDIGGKATDITTAMGASPEVAAGVGVAANVASQAGPSILGGKLAGKLASPGMESFAKDMMGRSMKAPLADYKSGDAAKAIQTMLDEGVAVSQGGLMKLRGKINELNNEITKRIANSNEIVDVAGKAVVFKPVREAINKFRFQANSADDVASINKAWNEFKTTGIVAELLNGEKLPVQVAQMIKQGTYQRLGEKAFTGELKSADIEGQKAVARVLKEEIASKVPGVADLNARESLLLNALDPAEKQVIASLRSNPGGWALLTHSPAAFAAYVADKSPALKSYLALMANSGKERIPEAVVGLGLAGTSATRENRK